MSTPTPVWEQRKENAAPLERGRSLASIEQTLHRSTVEHLIEQHEASICRHDNNKDTTLLDDPLIPWLAYIKFAQSASLPSDRVFSILERCVLHFQTPNSYSDANSSTTATSTTTASCCRYANDPRFVRVCCLYADQTQEPTVTFRELYTQKIGGQSATFWNAWAFTAERAKDYRLAEQVFAKGVRRGAQPLPYLVLRQQRFQRRMSRYWLNAVAAEREGIDGDADGDDYADRPAARGVLGAISASSASRRTVDRPPSRGIIAPSQSRSFGASVATFADRTSSRLRARSAAFNTTATSVGSNMNDENAKGLAFPVFEDGGASTPHFLDQSMDTTAREREREDERWKENRLAAERWNARGALGSTTTAAAVAAAPLPKLAAFAIHVDEECAEASRAADREREEHAAQQRRARDDRVDRASRTATSVIAAPVEKTTKEPSAKNKKTMHPVWKNRLLLRDGEEQNFEEARMQSRYYTLAPTSVNVNHFLLVHESSMSMSMDEASNFGSVQEQSFVEDVSMLSQAQSVEHNNNNTRDEDSRATACSHRKPPTASSRTIQTSQVRNTSHHPCNNTSASFDGITPRNASTASSTVDDRFGVGGNGGAIEPTINTQLALKELSMMFSSPAMAVTTDGNAWNGSTIVDDEDPSSVTDDPNSSFAPQQSESFVESTRKAYGTSMNKNPERAKAAVPPAAGFCVFEDPASDEVNCTTVETSVAPMASEQSEESKPMSPRRPAFPIFSDTTSPTPAKNSHTVFVEAKTKVERATSCSVKETFSVNTKLPFRIHDEDAADDSPSYSVGDTATFSAVNDVFQNIGAVATSKKTIEPSPAIHHVEGLDDDGDTATFSLMNDVLRSESGFSEVDGPAPFSRLADSDAELNDPAPVFSKPLVPHTSDVSDLESPHFGNISRVAPLEDATMTVCLPRGSSIDYLLLHSNDVKDAVSRVMKDSSRAFPTCSSLGTILAEKLSVYDLPKHALPRPFKRGPVAPGTHLKVGFSSAIVQSKLGKGANGTVVAIDACLEATHSLIAVKAQSPTGCLAWEYEILVKLEERQASTSHISVPPLFPRAISFVSFADGAMMAMSAGSPKGMNLIDLVNIYKTKDAHVPEILALHYTARMLRHLEFLHWHCKIIHSDTKPDNWILTECNDEDSEASFDLMLVDFGRAIDLMTVHPNNKASSTNLMDIVFTGSPTISEMECVSIRQGLPWSFDIDTFGLCASAHVLIYGSHLEIERNDSKRWMPKETKFPPGFAHTSLWVEVFDSLLNLDLGVAMGSRPYNLKRLRASIETCLVADRSKLQDAFRRQKNILLAAVSRHDEE